jgi:peptide/nickel transport system ATP-binding protein
MVLTVSGLKVAFDGPEPFTAVKDLSFSVDRGKTLAIVGESGSGKSLTALALMGLLPAAASLQGELLLQLAENSPAISLKSAAIARIRGADIGMVFQEPMSALNPVMSIGRQLREAILTHQNIGKQAAKELAIAWLQKVQLSDAMPFYDRYPHQLSGGQKQRVIIAMAMCNHPSLLIADEPTTALDTTVQQEIIRLMQFLQQEHGSAMIFITHDLALAAAIADDVLVMYKGEKIEYGPAAYVLKHPVHPYTKALLASRPSADQKGFRLPAVSDFLNTDGKTSEINYLRQPVQPVAIGEKLLDVNDLKIWFPGQKDMLGRPQSYFKAVDGVSFTLCKGEVLGLTGESGCGKSTLSRSLVGLVPMHDGSIMFEGQDLTKISMAQWKAVRHKIQMIFQDPYASLNPRMTIGQAIMEPLLVHGIVPRLQLRQEALRLLDLVQLPASAIDRYPHQFSGGQRQRIGIARALSLRPELLICDESVSALDVSIQAQILNLLKDLRAEFGLTYLFISHDLAVVHYISDRILIMQAGKIVETGTAAEVMHHPREVYTQKLINAMLVADR